LTFANESFRPKYNLIKTLEDEGFNVMNIPEVYPYHATFDCEAYFENEEDVVDDLIEPTSCKYATHKLLR